MGAAVAVRPAVLVTDTRGRGVSGVAVRFQAGDGSGHVSGESAQTGADGRATVGSWTLGARAGRQTLVASVAGFADVTFAARAVASTPATLAPLADRQAAVVATPLRESPGVTVTDEFDNPVRGVSVTFDLLDGGALSHRVVLTDSMGQARVTRWTLGPRAGVQRLTASVGTRSAMLVATAMAGAPSRLVPVSPLTQVAVVGTRVHLAPSVRVEDQHGNALTGEVVRFVVTRGSGSIPTTSVTTDALGRATLGHLAVAGAGDTTVVQAVAGAILSPNFMGVGVDFRRAHLLYGFGLVECGITVERLAFCWGQNQYGEIGNGSFDDALAPSGIPDGWQFANIAGTYASMCGALVDGGLACWGRNDDGDLGFIGRDPLTPRRLPGTSDFIEVAGGPGYCALGRPGTVSCWGQFPQRGPVRPLTTNVRFTRLFGGWQLFCGLEVGGEAWCWTAGDVNVTQSRIGDGTTTVRPLPARAGGGRLFRTLAIGGGHTCGIALDDVTWCWGDNAQGQLGDGTTTTQLTPVRVNAPERFVSVSASGTHTCAIGVSGSAWCWGANYNGELGDGTTVPSWLPTRVALTVPLEQVVAAGGHTCARSGAGRVWCWGWNVLGMLGNGTRTSSLLPVPVVQP